LASVSSSERRCGTGFVFENFMPPQKTAARTPLWLRNLQELIEERRLNPRQVSLQAGLNATAVRDMLSGRAKSPRYDTLQAIAKVLGTTPAWLMGDAVIKQDLRRGDKDAAKMELLTEIITRLQEVAESMKKKLPPKELATLATTLYRQLKLEDAASLSRHELQTQARILIMASSPLKARAAGRR
jgi:transcriptional regulator with XRE-family HTH domain